MKITILRADITLLDVDVIVNAANRSLLGGGGVDGAIHRAAGPRLLDECLRIRKERLVQGLPVGQAVITPGFDLQSKYIIHTVGPIFRKDDLALLKNCYTNSLKLADENNCINIAFPSISTGAFGVPIRLAVHIVKKTLKDYNAKSLKEALLVLHSDEDLKIYQDAFKQ
jgi:O-acetyl-ADP-ribose deacetylase (regulator of RNase III)